MLGLATGAFSVFSSVVRAIADFLDTSLRYRGGCLLVLGKRAVATCNAGLQVEPALRSGRRPRLHGKSP